MRLWLQALAHQPSAKPIMSQSGFDGELCNGNWHGTLRVTLEDDIDDSTLFSAKVYDVIYPLLEKFTKARGLWLRDVGFWVNGAITKLTTDERAGCMGMEENDQILVRLNGRRRLVVAAEGEGQRHLFECAGGTRWKTAMDSFKVRTGEGFVMLHDGQRVGANQRISTSTALGIVRAQQGGGGGAAKRVGQATRVASAMGCPKRCGSQIMVQTNNMPKGSDHLRPSRRCMTRMLTQTPKGGVIQVMSPRAKSGVCRENPWKTTSLRAISRLMNRSARRFRERARMRCVVFLVIPGC